MARRYRRLDLAEERMLTAKGILDSLDTSVPGSAWFALGYVKGLVDDTLGYLATPASKAGVEAYVEGAAAMEGYIQESLFGGDTNGK